MMLTNGFEQIEGRVPTFIGIDLETTGLDAQYDRILEVAWELLDERFEVIEIPNQRHHMVVRMTNTHHHRLVLSPAAREMHVRNGLLEEARNADRKETLPRIDREIDTALQGMYAHFGGREAVGRLRLFGSSVHFDQAFVNRHMPKLSKLIHYRVADVTSMKALAESKGWREAEDREIAHRAYDDLRWSIDIAQELRDWEAPR